MKSRRTASAVAAVAVIAGVISGATGTADASALTVYKFGGAVTCQAGFLVSITAKGSGTTRIYTNGGLRYTGFPHYGNMAYDEYDSPNRSISSWEVTVDNGALDDTGTLAWCKGTGANAGKSAPAQ